MKLTCKQQDLAKGLSIVGHAVSSRTTLPILSHILIAAEGETIRLSATNLEIGITCRVPAVVSELMKAGLIHEDLMTVTGRSIGDNCRGSEIILPDVIRPIEAPLKEKAGFMVLRGNLFDSAVMKTSVIDADFRARYLSNPADPNAFEGRAIVFDGPKEFHAQIDNPALAIDEHCILFMRGVGPVGYPGAPEVVNMRAPDYLIKRGIKTLACVGDGRQSGTSASPSILNCSPEAAVGGGLALLKTGDKVRIDLNKGEANILISEEELAQRRTAFDETGYPVSPSATPWQEIYRDSVSQLETGAVMQDAVKFQRVAALHIPKDSH